MTLPSWNPGTSQRSQLGTGLSSPNLPLPFIHRRHTTRAPHLPLPQQASPIPTCAPSLLLPSAYTRPTSLSDLKTSICLLLPHIPDDVIASSGRPTSATSRFVPSPFDLAPSNDGDSTLRPLFSSLPVPCTPSCPRANRYELIRVSV